MELLCLSLGRLLEDKDFEHNLHDDPVNLDKTIKLARQNKLSVLFERALKRSNELDTSNVSLRQDEKRTSASNSHVLHIIHIANTALEAEGIAHIFYKGPIQQKVIYGDFFAKPSVDADILVPHEDFVRARNSLTAAGFTVAPECDGLWWRLFLGEQHLFRTGSGPHSVDLHHRLQQPGSPAPRKLDKFLHNPTLVKLGARTIPTPGLPYIVMIAAMNLVKAIYNRQAGGSYAMDILTSLRRMTADEIVETHQEAAVQGLNMTVAFASRISALVFCVPDLFSDRPLSLPVEETSLDQLLLCPTDFQFTAPKRRDMLAYLCDNTFPDLFVEALRWTLSESARLAAKG